MERYVKCPQCKRRWSEDREFCITCGQALSGEAILAIRNQRLATWLKWIARVIGLVGVVFYFLFGMASTMFTEHWASGVAQACSGIAIVIAMVGLLISMEAIWLAGVLLTLSFISPLFLVIYVAMKTNLNISDLFFGLPSLIAGVLFLLSWWFSREITTSAPP